MNPTLRKSLGAVHCRVHVLPAIREYPGVFIDSGE